MSPAPSGTVGTGRVARAAPDGYTIVCGHFGTHATNGAVYQLNYDVVKDFAPISLLPRNPYLFVVRKNLPANNLKEFMAYVKANPDKVNMGHPGVGTAPHLAALQLQSHGRRPHELHSLSRRGAGDDRSDRRPDRPDGRPGAELARRMCARAPSRRWRSLRRSAIAQVADVPTVDEAGAPGLHMSLWYGFWAPAGTPKAIVAKLNAAVVEALADPAVRERLTGLGMEIPPREQQTPEGLLARAEGRHREMDADHPGGGHQAAA